MMSLGSGYAGSSFSRNIQESVSRAIKLGVDPTFIEAVTGVSKRQMQWITSEEKPGNSMRNQDCGCRRMPQRILKSEHPGVSNDGIAMIMYLFTKRTRLFTVLESL